VTTACPACGEAVSESARFCPACGTRLGALPDFTTSPAGLAGPPPGAVKLGSSSVLVEGGFAPGTVLGARFRIIGLLGVGGMGEVYRADDLRLGQAVALKFLPKTIVDNAAVLEQFYAEVRTARQIAHPNVCRVYDADEVDGRHFLSMEYIDGEDLASLLKRIGHLPAEKVLEIAQQLCAGLAAAHRKGVVHRDLKPANIMVDGRGYARITDFGLAVSVGYRPDAVLLAGTPLYMAPEQLSGASATIRSDIYALGLVLYELTTGRSPFSARNFEDLKTEKLALVPRRPSELARDVDPAVERVILKCIERDPIARPSSVLEVAAALPGGSPVSAAIAAGATPSPEMVAAASAESDGLTAGAAWALAAGLALSCGSATAP
jgi:serine/threonine protein kinase